MTSSFSASGQHSNNSSVKEAMNLFIAPGDMHQEVAAQCVAHTAASESISNSRSFVEYEAVPQS